LLTRIMYTKVEKVRKTGSTLMSLCGEPDKPEVKKHMEDLDHAWDNITALYARREENLIDAMEKAMEFHDTLQVSHFEDPNLKLRASEGTLSRWSRLHLQSLAPTCTGPAWWVMSRV
jgi:hypothetical protein